MTANISKDEIPVSYTSRPEVGQDFLSVSVPNGWDDLKHLTNKVLKYNGRPFTFRGWNSDDNQAYFSAPCGGNAKIAKICKR